MEPVRTATYKGHEVRLYVWLVPRDRFHTGMYEIYPRDMLAQRGVVSGKFATPRQAEEAALKSARRWIERTDVGRSHAHDHRSA